MKFFAAIVLSASLLSETLALPSMLRELSSGQVPDGASKLAFDGTHVIAYNAAGEKVGIIDPSKSAKLNKRTSTCTPLSSDDAQKIPGWTAVTDQAKANWGDGSYNLKTNMEDYPDSPANLCTSNNAAVMNFADAPTCTKSSQATDGQLQGSDGTISLTHAYSEKTTSSLTVTKSSALGVSVTLSATIGIPEVADVTTGITTSLDITNTQSTSTSTEKSDTLTGAVTMDVKAGQTCHLDYQTATCVAHGKGSIRFVASGWVWFTYEDKVDGHYFWALNLETIIPDEEGRSSTIDVDAVINVDSSSNFNGACV